VCGRFVQRCPLSFLLCAVCGRFVQRCPLSFLQSDSVKPLLACAIAGCALDHKEANLSVTKFLLELIKTARQKEVRLGICVSTELIS